MTTIHPDEVLAALKDGAPTRKARNFDILHEVCRAQRENGSVDFSKSTIGRLCEKAGGVSQKTLYNATSRDFITLLDAWVAFCQVTGKKLAASSAPLAQDDLLMRIPDPAVRALVASGLSERNRLRAQVNLLKNTAQIVIDERALPGYAHAQDDGTIVQVLPATSQLTDTERRALELALSAEYLAAQGLKEGSHGEILNAKGRVVFEMGFAPALRKMLK